MKLFPTSFLCYLLLLFSGHALAATRYVGTCGTPNTATIAAAITAASAGDEILICPGAYNEAVTVSKNNLTIRGSTGVRGDVTVSNAGIPFTLNATNPTLKDMTLSSSGNRGVSRGWTGSASTATFSNLAISALEYGIYVEVSTKVTMNNLNVSSTNSNAIHLAWGSNGAHEFDTITATANNGQAIYSAQGGATFRNLTLNAKNEALYASPASNAVFDTITATSTGSAGIYLGWASAASTLDFSNITVNAVTDGIYIEKSGKTTFNNVSVTSSNGSAVYLTSSASGAHTFQSSMFTAKNYGLYVYRGGATFSDLTVTSSNGTAILMYSDYDASFQDVTATATGGRGIHMGWANYNKDMTFLNVAITAKDEALYIEKSDVVTITGLTASSSNSDAVSFGYEASGAHVLSNMTLNAKESGVKFAPAVWSATMNNICVDSGKYGVWVSQWNSRNVSIQNSKLTATTYGIRTDANPSYKTIASNNCIMKAAAPRAYSNNTNHKFDGNYWQGVAGGSSYSDGNVHDASTLASCPVTSCSTSLSTVDHYEVTVPSSNLACLASTVTVKACADTSSPCANVATTMNGTASLATNAGTLGATSLAFSSGVATTTLSYPAAADGATATLTLSDESAAATHPRTCCVGASCTASNTCATTFNTAGLIFATAAGGATQTIANQTAGVASTLHYLRAVKTGSTTKACEAALTGSNAVTLGYACNNPASCISGNYMSIVPYNGGTPQAAVAVPSGGASTTLYFDANGNAPLAFNYLDVGNIHLTASKAASGSLLTALSGSSNAFVVKPYDFFLSSLLCGDGTANPTASDASGSKFCKAGNPFSATVTARNALGNATPNFGKETPAEGVELTHSLVAPGSGNPGTLGNGTITGFSAGAATATTLNWSEVGIITLTPAIADSNYLGAGNVTSAASGNVGRFYPARFALSSPTITNACTTGTTPFTYFGQDGFTTAFTLTAQNGLTTPTATTNYAGDGSASSWAKLPLTTWGAHPASAASPGFGFAVGTWTPSQPGGASLAASTTAPTATDSNTWVSGATTVTAKHRIVRSTNPAAPTTVAVTTLPVDRDGVTLSSAGALGDALQRFGVLRLINAYGSELLPARAEYRAEFWDGSRWATHTDDGCTSITAANIAGGGLTVAPGGVSTLANGTGTIRFNLAAAGGYDIALNLGSAAADQSCNASHPATTGADLAWLRGHWSSACGATAAWQQDPNARIRLGSPKAPYIYLRERY